MKSPTRLLTCFGQAVTLCGCAESMVIKSQPPGAKAFFDGVNIGSTPTWTEVPRGQVGLNHTWRVEFRNCEPAEGQTQAHLAKGRVVGYIFTLGILALFKGPYYLQPVNPLLMGGDCELLTQTQPNARSGGVTVQQIVGDRNVAPVQHTSKTQQLAERLTTLRDLYNRKLISAEIYEQETRKAIKELSE